MPDSVVIAAIFAGAFVLAHIWTRHCRRQAIRDHKPDQVILCKVFEFKRANLGSAYGPADGTTEGRAETEWEEAGGDERYASKWLRREVRE